MKKIIIVCPYPLDSAPSQRLHYEQYLEFLNANGYSFRVFSFFSTRAYSCLYKRKLLLGKVFFVLEGLLRRLALAFILPSADGVYIHLNVVPIGPCFLEWLYVFLSKSVIYDINDMVHLNRTSNVNKIADRLKTSERYYFLMRKSQHVITCTPYLEKISREYNSSTTTIFTTVNTDRLVPTGKPHRGAELNLGWSGSHSTAPYLYILEEPLKQLSQKHDFTLIIMGPDKFEMTGVKTKVIPWSLEVEVSVFAMMDIGLYPLPDDEWVKGKGGGKALQYMSCGLPLVATSAGCNGELIEDGVSGLLAKSLDDWHILLETLIIDADLRCRIGRAARSRVESLYSVNANKSTYLSIFEETYGPAR